MNWLDLSLELPITDPTWIFLLVLLIILFAPILLTKLRIPHIIGIALRSGLTMAMLLFAAAFFAPELLLGLLTDEELEQYLKEHEDEYEREDDE